MVEPSADRADARAIRALARRDGAEQDADRGTAKVAGRQAGEATAVLAGDVEQEPGPPAVVIAQASWVCWACAGDARRDYPHYVRVVPGEENCYRRVLEILMDHATHDRCATPPTPSGGNDNYR